MNSVILNYVPSDTKTNISSAAVNLIELALQSSNYSKLLICFWYCFAGNFVGNMNPTVSFLYNDVDQISLRADEGIVRLSDSGNLIIYGKELLASMAGYTDTGRLMIGIIPGYRFSQYIPERYPTRSLKSLLKNKDTTEIGTKFIVWIIGTKYLAIRDESIKYQTSRTIQRHLDFFYEQSVSENPSLCIKRKIEDDGDDIPLAVSAPKRANLASSSSGS